LALKTGSDEISDVLRKWMAWAQRCRIPVFKELRKKIRYHFDAIAATAKHGFSNAHSEAAKNKIKLVICMTYGFRNVGNMMAMVMLSCSQLRPALLIARRDLKLQ